MLHFKGLIRIGRRMQLAVTIFSQDLSTIGPIRAFAFKRVRKRVTVKFKK